jgi:hypothetical protein
MSYGRDRWNGSTPIPGRPPADDEDDRADMLHEVTCGLALWHAILSGAAPSESRIEAALDRLNRTDGR